MVVLGVPSDALYFVASRPSTHRLLVPGDSLLFYPSALSVTNASVLPAGLTINASAMTLSGMCARQGLLQRCRLAHVLLCSRRHPERRRGKLDTQLYPDA